MSRSRKKNPVCRPPRRRACRPGKKIASRAIRHRADVPNGRAFRKYYRSYYSWDYHFRKSEADLRREWDSNNYWVHRRFRTYEEAYRNWEKHFRRK